MSKWFAGLGVGAATMFLLDPISGRRRRHILKDKAVHASHHGAFAARKTATDLRHRTEGLASSIRYQMDDDRVDDNVLEARVRSLLGTISTHPRSIRVLAHDGNIVLTGHVLEKEAQRIVRRTAHIPGVTRVTDNLARHKSAEHIPALQGGKKKEYRFVYMHDRWPPGPRFIAGMTGLGMGAVGVFARGLIGGITTGAGSLLFFRAATNMPLKKLLGVSSSKEGVNVRKAIHISSPVEEVFDFFKNFENFPKFMEHLNRVKIREDKTYWEAVGPLGMPVHWESELTCFEPNKRIAWESVPGSLIRNTGYVRFNKDKKGTLVEVQMSYNPVGGIFTHAVATLFGSDPKSAFDDDLIRLKSIIESGKTRAKGRTIKREELFEQEGARA